MPTPELAVSVTPLYDRVVVIPEEKETVTASGIVIPDTASKEKPQLGTVIAVGPGGFDEKGNRKPMTVKVGDKVLFGKYSGDDLELETKEGKLIDVKIVHEDSVLGIVQS
jgi:chaperonin GroES